MSTGLANIRFAHPGAAPIEDLADCFPYAISYQVRGQGWQHDPHTYHCARVVWTAAERLARRLGITRVRITSASRKTR